MPGSSNSFPQLYRSGEWCMDTEENDWSMGRKTFQDVSTPEECLALVMADAQVPTKSKSQQSLELEEF